MANWNDKKNSAWKQTIWFHHVGRSVLFSQACMFKHLFYKVKVLKHSSWLIRKQNGTQNSISTFWPSALLYNFFCSYGGVETICYIYISRNNQECLSLYDNLFWRNCIKNSLFFSTLLCKCLLLIQKILNVSWKFWNIFWISFRFWGLKFYGVETHISKVANKATNVLQTNLWLVLRSHPKI